MSFPLFCCNDWQPKYKRNTINCQKILKKPFTYVHTYVIMYMKDKEGGDRMANKQEALQELLKLIADEPELAERITITIKPAKVKQGGQTKDKK